jgi:hypothetical protein
MISLSLPLGAAPAASAAPSSALSLSAIAPPGVAVNSMPPDRL